MALTNAYLLVVLVAVLVSLYLRSNVISEVLTNNKNQLAPIVQLAKIHGGKVQGIVQLTEDHRKVYLYQGIRYGHANRFELAKPANPWTEVYNATTYREACPQLPSQRMFGRIMSLLSKTDTISEDCLFVNVWRPVEDSKSKRAVMFWIHGGAFETGTIFTQAYDGRYLAHRGDVIVVSVNYRLGAFGFLTGGDVPGNLGLHDQILALKWVHENIEKFGGDPNQITIFGESAGGISVGALILSPLTKGLFKRAILQSGAQSGFYTSESKIQSLEKTKNLAQKLKCPIEKIEETIKCLKAKPMDNILKASQDAFTTNQLFLPIYGDDLMPVKPQEALKAGKFNQDLDLMYGVTKDEGSMFALALFPELRSAETKLTVNSTKDNIVKLIKHYYQNFGKEVAEFYSGKMKQEPTQDELRGEIGHVWGDYHLVCPTFLFAEFYAKQNPKNQFYSYQLVIPFSIPNMTIPSWVGVFHTTDLFFLFMIPLTQTTYEHYELSLDMIQAWTQFAKTGHPGKMRYVDWVDSFDDKRKLSTCKTMILDPMKYQIVEGVYREACDVFWKPKIFN